MAVRAARANDSEMERPQHRTEQDNQAGREDPDGKRHIVSQRGNVFRIEPAVRFSDFDPNGVLDLTDFLEFHRGLTRPPLVRESLLALAFAEIPSCGPLETMERRIGILLRVGTR